MPYSKEQIVLRETAIAVMTISFYHLFLFFILYSVAGLQNTEPKT